MLLFLACIPGSLLPHVACMMNLQMQVLSPHIFFPAQMKTASLVTHIYSVRVFISNIYGSVFVPVEDVGFQISWLYLMTQSVVPYTKNIPAKKINYVKFVQSTIVM